VSAGATAVSSLVGVVLVVIAFRDIFDSLFHPEGRAAVGRLVSRAVWVTVRRLGRGRPRVAGLAGPLVLVAVISTWALLLIVGWALIYLPHVNTGFDIPQNVGGGDLVNALHISLNGLTTLGASDAIAEPGWLRIVNPLEALVGFGLLTASVSWLLLVYPALGRRRSLAYELSLLLREEEETGTSLVDLEPVVAERVYADLTDRLIAVERDFVNFPVSYYFTEGDPRFSLASSLPYALDLARRGTSGDTPNSVRLRARMLEEALGDLAATTAHRFHRAPGESAEDLLHAYARDQPEP